MVEYGGGVSHGPAGQVSGSTHPFGSGNVDLGASIGSFVDNAVHTVSTMPPGMLAIAVVMVILGLILLRRAF